jgi:hypothetical protein
MGANISQTLTEMFQSPSATIKCLKCGKMSDEDEKTIFWKISSRQIGAEEEGKSLSSCSSCQSKNLEMMVKWNIEYHCIMNECSECNLIKVDITNWEKLVEEKKEKTFNFPIKPSKEVTIKEFMQNISKVCECEAVNTEYQSKQIQPSK